MFSQHKTNSTATGNTSPERVRGNNTSTATTNSPNTTDENPRILTTQEVLKTVDQAKRRERARRHPRTDQHWATKENMSQNLASDRKEHSNSATGLTPYLAVREEAFKRKQSIVPKKNQILTASTKPTQNEIYRIVTNQPPFSSPFETPRDYSEDDTTRPNVEPPVKIVLQNRDSQKSIELQRNPSKNDLKTNKLCFKLTYHAPLKENLGELDKTIDTSTVILNKLKSAHKKTHIFDADAPLDTILPIKDTIIIVKTNQSTSGSFEKANSLDNFSVIIPENFLPKFIDLLAHVVLETTKKPIEDKDFRTIKPETYFDSVNSNKTTSLTSNVSGRSPR